MVQVAYAIGVAQPVGLFINTYNTSKVNKPDSEIGKLVNEIFDLRPAKIVERFGLTNPIFLATASYGHMGREPYVEKVNVKYNGKEEVKEVQFFGWEKLDYVDKVKAKFGLK